MQALSQASPQNPPHFSKSAPNLDKSRAAGNDSPTSATSSHNNFLGKSVDGLNIIKTNNNKTNNNSYSNSTKSGSVDHLNNGDRYVRHIELHDDEDDDDDDGVKSGCFSIFNRNGDSLVNRKKHSLDSKMADAPTNSNNTSSNSTAMSPISALHSATRTFVSVAYAQSVGIEDESHRPNNAPDYDRVFYRKLQKSLDNILSNDQYQPFERVHFDREHFLVKKNGEHDSDSIFDNGNDSSFDAGTSTNQELSEKSMDLSLSERSELDKSSSQEHIFPDESMHLSCDTASTSRKNSVTFRDDDDSLQYGLFNIPVDRSAKFTGPYAIITHPNWSNQNHDQVQNQSNVLPKSTPVKKDRKDKSAYFKLKIFRHKKNSKSDLDEKLLDEDSKYYAQA